jgi:DNA-binding NarL/FixJ family response regulator
LHECPTVDVVVSPVPMSSLRLVLAVEPTLLRAGLRSLIGGFTGLLVVAETDNGREAVSLAKDHRPELVLMSGLLPLRDVPETVRRIRRCSPLSRIIILSEDGRTEAPGAGEFLSAAATAGEFERMLRAGSNGDSPSRAPAKNGQPLTPRQVEVLRHLSEGGGVKRASRLLGISIKTVETHRAQLMKRLKIFDLAGLVRYALREEITRL